MAYSAVGLSEKPVDGQSIRENLTEKVSGVCACASSSTITSRASEGVKEGRASKIGVVSGVAIYA